VLFRCLYVPLGQGRLGRSRRRLVQRKSVWERVAGCSRVTAAYSALLVLWKSLRDFNFLSILNLAIFSSCENCLDHTFSKYWRGLMRAWGRGSWGALTSMAFPNSWRTARLVFTMIAVVRGIAHLGCGYMFKRNYKYYNRYFIFGK